MDSASSLEQLEEKRKQDLRKENLEFMPDSAYYFQEESTSIALSRGLKDLTNLELHHPDN
mgnify:CR=1 FL=1